MPSYILGTDLFWGWDKKLIVSRNRKYIIVCKELIFIQIIVFLICRL